MQVNRMYKHENALVSVVVPVYNVEKYIARCIESILSQTYENLELILVDDGSPDQSGVICDDYANKDSRILVIHQKNAGVSAARNVGIDHAKGEHIFFVDSDDWIEPNHVESLLPIDDEDLVCGGFIQLIHNQKDAYVSPASKICTCAEWRENFWNFWLENAILPPWRSCYSAHILRENHIRFNCALSIGEDEHFNLQYIAHCRTIRFVSSCTYCYEIGGQASAMQKWHPSRINTAVALSKAIEEMLQKREYLARWYYWHGAIRHLDKWHQRSTGTQKREVCKKMSECFNEPYFRECLPYIRKNGTLDERIEAFFMRRWLHSLYEPMYSFVVFLSKIKNYLLRK